MALDATTPPRNLTPREVRAIVEGAAEYALLDVREEGEFGLGHILLSSNIPFSRLEAEVRTRIPRPDVPVILVGDAAVVARAGEVLGALGYSDLATLTGGPAAWAAEGWELFDGGNVFSKAFAEVLEVEQHTPHVSPEELARLQEEGADFVLLDTRTPEEFSRYHVPGAVSAPGVELIARAEAYIPTPETLVVVSCAGRTRSIIGAQGLINFGIENRVVSLAGGTQGWRIAGFELETSPAEEPPALSGRVREAALARAARLRERYGIPLAGRDEVTGWLGQEGRTTYLIDVRSRAEYEAGHVGGALWVPGGQLVQATDLWIGVQNARIVLTDTDGIRASIAAHWLRQYGRDVAVLIASGNETVDSATAPWARPDDLPEIAEIDPAGARGWLGDGVLVSADPSGDYHAAHPAGALWRNRSLVVRTGAGLPAGTDRALVVARDRAAGTLLAAELGRAAGIEVALLPGGEEAWTRAGFATESSAAPDDAERVDTLFWLHRRHLGDLSQSQAYLDWELELPGRIARDGLAHYDIR